MTAFRVDIPRGIAAPVWMTHVLRAAAQAFEHPLPNPPSLRLRPEEAGASLIAGAARDAREESA